METQSLIELRRLDALEDASDASAHGDYTILLKQPVVLNEGDSVVLNRSFIDTRGQLGNTIDIPDDIQITGKYIVWVQNWWNPLPEIKPSGGNPGNPGHEVQVNRLPLKTQSQGQSEPRPNGYGPFKTPGFFVACTPPNFTPTTNSLGQLLGIQLRNGASGSTTIGGQYISFHFSQNPNDQNERSGKITLWVNPTTGGDEIVVPCNLLVGNVNRDQDWIEHLNPAASAYVMDSLDATQEADLRAQPQRTDGPFVPMEFDFDFTLQSGSYTPTSLAQKITASMSVVESLGLTSEPKASQFIQRSKKIPVFMQVHNQDNIQITEYDPYNVNFFSIMDENEIYVGASETALEFDGDSNTFRFTYLHTPLLDVGGAPSTKSVLYNNLLTTQQDPPPFWIATAHSGIAFTELEPKAFWEGQLGFDLQSLLIDNNFNYRTNIAGGVIVNAQTPVLDLVPGKNITAAFEGAASVLANSQNTTTSDFYYVKTVPEEFINTNLTTPIIASPLPPQVTDTSHYLVEVSGVPMSQMISSKTQTFSLAGVVGRYQTRGSFTEGGGGDGAPTQIFGNSVVLSKLHVRILNPDRTPVSDMGPQSSVFLTITRQIQLPPPLPPVLAAQPPGLLPPPEQPGEDEPPAKKAK